MIDHATASIFVHIPRTGGTSIEQAMVGRSLWHEDRALKHAPAVILRQAYTSHWAQYFIFSFVRHPCDWLLSYYRQVGRYVLTLDGAMARKPWPVRFRPDAFERFVLYGELKPPTQSSMLTIDGEVAVDFVGRYEELNVDFLRIMATLGQPPVTLPRLIASRPAIPWRRVYTRRMCEVVASLYSEDFERFGYGAST